MSHPLNKMHTSQYPATKTHHTRPVVVGPQSNSALGPATQAESVITEGLWCGFPESLAPILNAAAPSVLNENDRILGSLLLGAPDRVFRPPSSGLPTSRDGLLVLYRDICIQLGGFTDEALRIVIDIVSEKVTIQHIFLLMNLFQYPEDIDNAIAKLAEVLTAMFAEFRRWGAAWDAPAALALYANRNEGARHMTQRGMGKLLARAGAEKDLESRWLYSLLRSIGHLPEVWTTNGIASQMPRVPSHDAQDVPLPSSPSSDLAAQLGKGRGLNNSFVSLSSISSLGSKHRSQVYPSTSRISRFQNMIQEERFKLLQMEHDRDTAKMLMDTFYRSLLMQYSHQFMGSQMSEAYLALIVKFPNALAPLIIRCCEQMHNELDALSKLVQDL